MQEVNDCMMEYGIVVGETTTGAVEFRSLVQNVPL